VISQIDELTAGLADRLIEGARNPSDAKLARA
jgi:hypothetical protein